MKVGVLGGGAAGLSAGVALRRAGVEVLLVEAETRAGGKLRTVEAEGYRCEDGPNALTAQSPTALRLTQEAGLSISEAQPPRTRYVFRRGKLRAAAPPQLLGLLSPLGWARLALEPLAALRRAREEETLQAFLGRHVGREAGELGARLLANGVYAGDPRRLSASEAFPRMTALEQSGRSLFVGAARRPRAPPPANGAPRSLWIPVGGMSALTSRLAARIGDGVHLGTRVERLLFERGGYDLVLSDGTARVDGLICTVPPREAASLLAPLAPGAEELRRVRSAPLAMVHLGFRSADFARAPRGFGALDGDGALSLLGVLFVSSLFAGKAPEGQVLLTCLVGGLLRTEALGWDDATLVARCRDDLSRLLGVSAEPGFSRVARWEEAVPQPELGHRALLSRVTEGLARLPAFELAGAAYDGVSVEQALAAGERAAARLLARLRSAQGAGSGATGLEA